MKRYIEHFEDFYGCTYSLRPNAGNSCDLTARVPQGDIFYAKHYSSYLGARIALGKISEGTARPTGKKEVI